MSDQRFIKFIPSPEAMWLVHNQANAFRLLTIIATLARRESGNPDGLQIGEAFIGDWKSYGMSEQNYRTAKDVLVKRQHLKILETNRTRKKSTTGVTTKGTKVKLLTTNVYDINKNDGNDCSNDCLTTAQRLPNDDQEGIRRNKNDKKDHQSSLPSFSDEDLIDDPFPKKEERIHIYKEVFLTQTEIDECIKIKGSRQAVEDCIKKIIDNPKRKMVIQNWPATLLTWKFSNTVLNNIQENHALGEKIEKIYGNYNAWSVRVYRDKIKDEHGILFEGSGQSCDPMFISFSDANFSEKTNEFLKLKKMKKIGEK